MGSDLRSGKYREVISLVINKFGVPVQDQEDMEQEAELALFLAESELAAQEFPDKLAYKIVRNRIIDCLRKTPPKADDISKPYVVDMYDRQTNLKPNVDTVLDAEKAAHLVNRLPDPYKFILISTFGLEDNPQFTESELAYLMQRSPDWVSRKKAQALAKLKTIMERK